MTTEAGTLTEDQARIIDEYTTSLYRLLRENAAKIPPHIFGEPGHIIRWLGQEITRNDAPAIKKAGQRIKRDLVYYELSL